MSRLGGVILAAGLSSRMKQFKPLMMIDGKSMIRHVIDLMRGAGAETIVVVTGHNRARIEAHLADAGVLFAFNPDYAHTQQLESLRIGLSALHGHASPPPMCRWFRRKPFATCLRSPGTSCDPCITEKPDTPSFWTLLSFPC